MPQFTFAIPAATFAAGTTINPLAGWQYEFLPFPARVKMLIRASAIGTVHTIYSGSETIVEESPIQAGGTAGTTPSDLNTPSVEFLAPAGDRLKVNLRNPTGGGVAVDGIVYVHPVG